MKRIVILGLAAFLLFGGLVTYDTNKVSACAAFAACLFSFGLAIILTIENPKRN